MSVDLVLAVVFGAIALATSISLVVVVLAWRRTRHYVALLERSLPLGPPSGAVETVGRVARSVVQQAARLREHGLSHVLSSSLEDLVRWAKADRERIARVADKDGTVTLFFSDIADSTALNEQLGDTEWVRVLAEHDRLVRREIERRAGVVVKTMGDGFMAVFPGAEAAVLAALAIHDAMRDGGNRRLRRTPLAVRIGVHTGTAVTSGDDYLGRNVALCARIASHAEAGQTLASSDTQRAAAGADGLTFVPQQRVAFKGITEPVDFFEVRRSSEVEDGTARDEY
jgi:adenylate cyclase